MELIGEKKVVIGFFCKLRERDSQRENYFKIKSDSMQIPVQTINDFSENSRDWSKERRSGQWIPIAAR